MDVFYRYAPFIQDYIFRSGWKTLRGVQNAAGEAIFGTDLINDQFGRLNELCEEAGIPVYRWHGDVSQSQKRKLLKKPSGILQITPESLESLMINKHMEIPSLFEDLRFIVIDEIHSLLRGDRGMQTFCLIERMCRLAGCDPRRIGLSATIGNPELAGEFLASGSTRPTVIPKFDGGKEMWRLSMEHFFNTDPQADEDKEIAVKTPDEEEPTDTAPKSADPGMGYIFEHTRGKKMPCIYEFPRGV